ncbi:6-carboxytetrahydropterin synthase [Alicyclobacillaceae bacterium I2511]|nr:6-carboxytetrahydropterin synthase [Alicyclobacillaceae bacterium I2511]
MSSVRVCKTFTFDAAHQLLGHSGKCANLHGHTYTLEVVLEGEPMGADHPSEEGFVLDFGDLKRTVQEVIANPLDHAFLAMGNEPVLATLQATGSKVAVLGFRATAENLALYTCHLLQQAGLPVYSVKLWETRTAWAEVYAKDVPTTGPTYCMLGDCDDE